MHELSIALSILDMAAAEAERHAGRVAVIHLRLGPLAGVVKEALASAFTLARAASPLATADLVIEETPLVAHCPRCNEPRTLPSLQSLSCPECGSPTAEIISGRELEVRALEIDT